MNLNSLTCRGRPRILFYSLPDDPWHFDSTQTSVPCDHFGTCRPAVRGPPRLARVTSSGLHAEGRVLSWELAVLLRGKCVSMSSGCSWLADPGGAAPSGRSSGRTGHRNSAIYCQRRARPERSRSGTRAIPALPQLHTLGAEGASRNLPECLYTHSSLSNTRGCANLPDKEHRNPAANLLLSLHVNLLPAD